MASSTLGSAQQLTRAVDVAAPVLTCRVVSLRRLEVARVMLTPAHNIQPRSYPAHKIFTSGQESHIEAVEVGVCTLPCLAFDCCFH
eukprot:1212727-Pleurochrysis_carterae.AAC.3